MDLDCMISPGCGLPPYKHGKCDDLILAHTYTAFYNALDMPAGIIPSVRTIVKEDLQETYNDPRWGEDTFVKPIRENLVGTEGLKLGIQLATLVNEEEKCLGLMNFVD